MASVLNHSFLRRLASLLHCPAGERVPSFQGTTGPVPFKEQLEQLSAASSGSVLCSRSFADLAGPQRQFFWIAGPSFWPEAELFSSQPGETE